MRPLGARLISPSSIQNFHSLLGDLDSAFGNAGVLSAASRPFTWSAWKCEITTTSIALRSIAGGGQVVLHPAALAFALREHRLAVAGIDQHAFAAGLHHDRRIGVRMGRWEARGRERGDQFLLGRIRRCSCRAGHAEAVGEHRHGNVAELVTMNFGRHEFILQLQDRPGGARQSGARLDIKPGARLKPLFVARSGPKVYERAATRKPKRQGSRNTCAIQGSASHSPALHCGAASPAPRTIRRGR